MIQGHSYEAMSLKLFLTLHAFCLAGLTIPTCGYLPGSTLTTRAERFPHSFELSLCYLFPSMNAHKNPSLRLDTCNGNSFHNTALAKPTPAQSERTHPGREITAAHSKAAKDGGGGSDILCSFPLLNVLQSLTKPQQDPSIISLYPVAMERAIKSHPCRVLKARDVQRRFALPASTSQPRYSSVVPHPYTSQG